MALLFVTGTGTGVGKTIVAASLARALAADGIAVHAIKPVATGVGGEQGLADDALLAAAIGAGRISAGNWVRLREPLAPLASARLQGARIDPSLLVAAIRGADAPDRITIVEGVGGVAVPISEKMLVGDLAAELACPVLVVADARLGTVNHSLLTIEHLRLRDVAVLGVIFVLTENAIPGLAEETGPRLVEEFSGVPNLGTVPFVVGLAAADLASVGERLPWTCPAIAAAAAAVRRQLVD